MTITEQIYALIYEFVPLAILLVGFVIGMVNILKKKAPYFFTLIIFAVGCLLIEQISFTVNTVCGIYDDIGIGTLGVFGCNFFMLSANYGALNKVVDEKVLPLEKKLLSLDVPIILATCVILIFFIWKDRNMLCAVVFALILVPAIPTSYYNVKHLMIREDAIGILKAIKGCDIMSLVFIFMAAIYLFVEASGSIIGIIITSIMYALAALGMVLAAVKGIKQWKI